MKLGIGFAAVKMNFWSANPGHPVRRIVDGLLGTRSAEIVSTIDRFQWYEQTERLLKAIGMRFVAWFAESPDAGPECLCSWCGQPILEDQGIPIRMFDKEAGLEARFHTEQKVNDRSWGEEGVELLQSPNCFADAIKVGHVFPSQ